MSEIAIDCAGELDMKQFPCYSNDYGYPVKLVIGQPKGIFAVVGETPTLAEIEAGLIDTGLNKLIVIEELTNGARAENDVQEESGADTADGLRTVFATNILTSGKVKLLDESLRADLAVLAKYARLKTWTITSGGWIFGGKTGYRTSNYISPLFAEGFGTRAAHDISFIHQHNMNQTDPAGFDEGFLDIVNSSVT